MASGPTDLREHHHYLSDPRRLALYERALSLHVRPGDVVLDLGAGTGVLGMLALQLGAARVYAVERTRMWRLGQRLAQHNGWEDKVQWVCGAAQDVTLPERVDLVVGDQLGGFGIHYGALDDYADAAARHLEPGGTLLPAKLELWLAPWEAAEAYQSIGFWRDARPGGLDVSPALDVASNSFTHADLPPGGRLAPPEHALSYDLTQAHTETQRAQLSVTCTRAGTLHGLGGWFRAQLAPEVWLTNDPCLPERIQRQQVLFPLRTPLSVAAGTTLELELSVPAGDPFLLRWRVRCPALDVDQAGSTFHALLVGPQELAKRSPEHRPVLAPAQRTLLELIDGQRTVREVAAELYTRHPETFTSRSHALRAVRRHVQDLDL